MHLEAFLQQKNIPHRVLDDGTWVLERTIDAAGSQLNEWPDKMVVQGDFILRNTPNRHLPENLVVEGGLDIAGTAIRSIDENVSVGTWLDASNSMLQSINANRSLNGFLNLNDATTSTLPTGLTVHDWLDASGTQISAVPSGLSVGGDAYFGNTPLKTIAPGSRFGGNLDLWRTNVRQLSDVQVAGSVVADSSALERVDEDAMIGGLISVTDTPYAKAQGVSSIEPSGPGLGGWDLSVLDTDLDPAGQARTNTGPTRVH